MLVLTAARTEEPEASSSLRGGSWPWGRRLPVRSLAPGTLAEEDVEVLLRGLLMQAHRLSPLTRLWRRRGAQTGRIPRLERLGEWLAAETEGQPFYLVETIKAPPSEEGMLLIRNRADGETVVDVGPALRAERSALRGLLPKSVREVIHVRLSRLSPAGSELLGAGAVLSGALTEMLVGVADLGRQKA